MTITDNSNSSRHDNFEAVRNHWGSTDSIKVQNYLKRGLNSGDTRKIVDERLLLMMKDFFADKSVLDLGAGVGRMLPIWRRVGAKVVVSDWSPAFASTLAQRARDYGYRAAQFDITEREPDEHFDIIFSTQVMLHIPPSKIRSAIKNMASSADWLFMVSWKDDTANFDEVDGKKIHSFNHDYDTLFNELGLPIFLKMRLYFEKTRLLPERDNFVYVVEVKK